MHRRSLALAAMLSVCAFPVAAQVTIPEEYGKAIKTAETVGALGDNLFGEETSFYTGATTFGATDVSLPGNNAIPVAVGRRYSVEGRTGTEQIRLLQHDGSFADWDLDIPHLHGTYSVAGWQVDGHTTAGMNARCSQPESGSYEAPIVEGTFNRLWSGPEYWQGTSMYIPGQGDQTMMMVVGTGLPKPTDGKTYRWVTNGLWYFSCLDKMTLGAGEGFEAVSPQGLRYTFDWMVSRDVEFINKNDSSGALLMAQKTGDAIINAPPNSNATSLNRKEVWILPTKVEDRFGNRVTYTYNALNPWRLEKIASTDGRVITLTYNASGYIATVNDGTRTWTYEYANGLSGVVLPDSSRWTIDFTTLRKAYATPYSASNECDDPTLSPVQTTVTGTITHPSGAVGQFSFTPKMHGRSYVNRVCRQTNWPSTEGYVVFPNRFNAISLTQKKITGPGIATMQWDYTYGAPNASWLENCPTDTSCTSTKTVEAIEPDGTWTRWTFGNRYKVSEGKLLKVETGTGPTNILRTTATTYQLDPTGMPYARIGMDPFIKSDFTSENFRPEIARTITQQGRTFNWLVQSNCDAQGTPNATGPTICLDQFARATKVRRYSGTDTRTDATWFEDNLAKWVVGKPRKSLNTDTNRIVSETSYDPTTALPLWTKAFDKLKLTATWNPDGTLATTSDGRDSPSTNTTVGYSIWKRGIPQVIAFPDGYTKQAVVENPGWISSVTDENGYVTCYGYDQMGRLNKITYPNNALIANAQACGTDAWNTWDRTFVPVATAEVGLPAAHWREQITTGNMRKFAYYDALWRPVLTQTYDITNTSGTLSQSVTRYDADGHPVFQSYPQTGITDFNQTLKGTRSTYDALGRQTRVEQDAEAELNGILATTTDYLSGFQVRVTNPRGKVTTTTSFKVYDQPSTDLPVSITAPEGAVTDINRDIFGKPKAIIRHDLGNIVQVTRSYTYNPAQELCLVQEPETGSSYMGYDAAGNLEWSASGYGPASACATKEAVAARRSDRLYDSRNRLVDLSFADDTGEQVWSYTPDGLPATITTYNAAGRTYPYINTYSYNKRRLVGGQGESGQDGSDTAPWYTYSIGYGYDKNGALANNVYPDSQIVDYAPNALGQATKAGTYATGVTYYPNGAINQFTYGNGVIHKMDQNERQLPERSRDYYGTGNILYDSYDYDANGNVVAISDGTGGRGNRDMTYDDLDRLTSTTSPRWFGGTIIYTYDVLDNIQSVARPNGQSYHYCYNTAGQLEFLRNGEATACNAGSAAFALTYDPQGNLYQKNAQRYAFTQDNRLRNVTGLEYYRYDGYGRRTLSWSPTLGNLMYLYGQDGTLRFMNDVRRGKSEHYVYLGGSLVAIREVAGSTTTIKYQHTDALGSPAVVTDAARNVVERSEREPYGKLLNRAMHDGPGFTGHAEDALTGLSYMQQRYYDPWIGAFLSVDPVTAYRKPGASFNRYWYANDNPFTFKDPDGRECKSATGMTSCTPYRKGWDLPTITFPTPYGWPDTITDTGLTSHEYRYETSTDGKSDESVQDSIANDPTPGDDKPATQKGTANDASPKSGPRQLLSALADSPVKSYVRWDKNGNKWTINVTLPGHPLFPGFVMRGAVGGKIITYGQGAGVLQAGGPLSQLLINDVWKTQNRVNVDNAK